MSWKHKLATVIVLRLTFRVLELRQSYWRANAQKRQPVNSLRWPIYVFNSVDNTKLPWKNSGLGEMTRENEPLTRGNDQQNVPLPVRWKFGTSTNWATKPLS